MKNVGPHPLYGHLCPGTFVEIKKDQKKPKAARLSLPLVETSKPDIYPLRENATYQIGVLELLAEQGPMMITDLGKTLRPGKRTRLARTKRVAVHLLSSHLIKRTGSDLLSEPNAKTLVEITDKGRQLLSQPPR